MFLSGTERGRLSFSKVVHFFSRKFQIVFESELTFPRPISELTAYF